MANREPRRQYRRTPASIKQEQDDDSDAEESQLGFKKSDGRESQIIHSGHFMVSSPHIEHPPKKGYDFDTVNKQTCQTYHFGKTSTSHLSIDASLTKLFECMTLAYSGKLVSPKWKNFKGLKLLWRDKIRLNNAIWRAWYMQYVEKRENPVCHFVTPLDGNIDMEDNRPAEAIATEGKYWKRRIEIVIREYHKWRTYFKKRKHKDDDLSSLLKGPEEQFSLFGEVFPDTLRVSFWQDEELAGRRIARRGRDSPIPMEMDSLFDMDVLMSEFSDTLFSTLASHQPIGWPNPREIAHAGNADMIQPGLIPLQPNLDFMDSFEPLQDLFHRQPVLYSASLTAQSVSAVPSSSCQTQAQLLPSMHLSTDLGPPPDPLSLSSPLSLPSPLPLTSSMPVQASGTSGCPAYMHDYLPLFPGPIGPRAPAVSPLNQTAPRPPLPPASRLEETPSQTVITHTASPSPSVSPRDSAPSFSVPPRDSALSFSDPPRDSAPSFCVQPRDSAPSFSVPPRDSTSSFSVPPRDSAPSFSVPPRDSAPSFSVPPRDSAPSFSHAPDFCSPSSHAPPLQPQGPSPPPLRQHPQTFALPKPIHPSNSSKKTRHVQRIVPANPLPSSSHLILTAPFPGHTGAVLVTQSPLKPDAVPSNMVLAGPPSLAPSQGFHILPQTHKAQQLIVPKEETRHKTTAPSGAALDGLGSGQGSPCGSEQAPSPQSPLSSTAALSKNESNQSRRGTHISTEQKRRFNINIGFKTLCNMVPSLKSQSNISNAATLQKTVEYVGKLQQDRQHLQEETKRLREEIEELNASINTCQEQLPATGVPITRHRFDHMREKFDEYVKSRTLQNWKFWIFSIIIKPLFESFNGSVSITSKGELCESTLQWLERHCSLPVLRPTVLGTLRQLSTSTSILTDPALLPEEARQAVANSHNSSGDS
ncbi:MLX-interacting protein isoform X2 [Hypomesus transpacificus]|uniref:MLX-interacting protein isoform X2 n=1 Tax=Hypomesus transpacificus TaxID=137520 RepID=UPI001F083D11|nr:MLX-interacting protein isoform X2 [Hypomesus transpacificus]